MGFVANFVRFQQSTYFENPLRFDKVTKSVQLGTFLKTQCINKMLCESITLVYKHCFFTLIKLIRDSRQRSRINEL